MAIDAADDVQWNSDGLVPVIAQDHSTGKVLMLAWMNREALASTLIRGEVVYYSRSRQKLWHKGESSGHTQRLVSLRMDCDADVLLASVEQRGGIACHTGREHCFYREWHAQGWQTTEPVKVDPSEIYSKP